MAEKTNNNNNTATKNNNNSKSRSNKTTKLLPFDELPVAVKRNRRALYEYIRTGELQK